MKRLLTTIAAALASLTMFAGTAFADSPYWQINIYQPTSGTTNHTLQIEFKALSTEASDQINVQLYENGSALAGQSFTTTKPYGDSGFFTLNNVADGTYTFHVVGTNNADSDSPTQTTPDRTVTVTTAHNTTVVVNQSSTGSSSSSTGEATTSSQALGSSTGSNGSTSTTTGNGSSAQGQVNAPGSSKTQQNNKNNNGKVLGIQTSKSNSTTWQWIGIIIAVLFVLGLLYRLFFRRANP